MKYKKYFTKMLLASSVLGVITQPVLGAPALTEIVGNATLSSSLGTVSNNLLTLPANGGTQAFRNNTTIKYRESHTVTADVDRQV